jgi:hypothetical protein
MAGSDFSPEGTLGEVVPVVLYIRLITFGDLIQY